MRKKPLFAIVVAAAFCTTAHAGTLVLSPFDTSAEGWSVADLSTIGGAAPTVAANYTVSYAATGGNPGGYIFESDPSSNTYYYQAPAKFLGNQSAALNGTLSFDIADSPVTTLNPGESPIILVGANESIYFPDATSITTTFSTVSYTLGPGHGGAVNGQGGTTATLADFSTVLGNLQALYVLGDYYNGTDTSTLDNVRLASGVPEPTTATVVGLGVAAGMAWLRKHRRQRAVCAR